MSSNGYLTPSELTYVPGGQLSNATASAWNSARSAALRENAVTLTIAQPAGAYRSRAVQLDMRANPGKYNITPGVLPGLPSDHGFGTCVDVAGGILWAINNLHRFGFVRDKLNFNDPNHFHYVGTSTAGGGSTPIESADMDATQDQRLKNIEAILAMDNNGGMRAVLAAVSANLTSAQATINNIQAILANDAGRDVRAIVRDIQATVNGISIQSGQFTPTDRAMLDDIANKAELSSALTNTVNLVNSHADANKAQIIQEIDTHSGSSLSAFTATITPVE